MKILLSISYDGTNYKGWQRQTNFVSIQEEIEKAISKIYNKDIKILGASRTDAGVHALDQKATFVIDKSHIPPDKIYILINKILPKDIRIKSSELVPDNFHPMVHVSKKTYKFSIYNGDFENPLYRNISLFVKDKLDVDKMNQGAKEFIGTYDFVAFCKNAKDKENTIRTIYDSYCYKENDFIHFVVTGNGFLHNMVRTIMATLIDVGNDKIEVSDLKKIILSKKREFSSKTADGSGLCLTKIYIDMENMH